MTSSLSPRVFIGLANMGMRAAGLSLRFALTLFIAHFLGIDALGAFGLLYAVVVSLPAILGMGLNYSTAREIVTLSEEAAVSVYRDRLAVSVALSAAASFIFAFFLCASTGWPIQSGAMTVIIVVCEVVLFDLHYGLLARKRSLSANVFLFLRTSLWIPPFMILSFVFVDLRTVGYLLIFWAAGVATTCGVVLLVLLRHTKSLPLHSTAPFTFVSRRIYTNIPIWLGDIFIVAAAFSDRFIVTSALGLSFAGLYVFYWSIANGTQMLISSSVVQPIMPHIVSFANDRQRLRQKIGAETIHVLVWAVPLFLFMYVLASLVVPYLQRPELVENTLIMVPLMMAAIFRLCSDVNNYGMYALGSDGRLLTLNSAAAIAGAAAVFAGASIGGLLGACIGLAVSEASLLSLRVFALRRLLVPERT